MPKPLKKLSKDGDAPNPESEVKSAVKSQELADLCAIFGDSNGIKLFQEGADVNEVRQWQSLNDKYAKYLSASSDDDEPKADDEPPKEGEPKTDDEPPKEDEPEKDKDKLSASAILTKLNAMDKKLELQTAEIVKLKAAIPPNGAEPVSHNAETPKAAEQPKNSVQKYAVKYKK